LDSPRTVAAESSSSSFTEASSPQVSGFAGVPEEFAICFKAFLSGQENLTTLRKVLERSLWTSLEPAAAIQSLLEAACDSGVLAPAEGDVLAADVARITTEETPTDMPIGAALPLKTSQPVSAPSVSEDVEPGPGSVLKNRYQLEELVAERPMSKVYRAADRLKQEAGANPTVAIKMLSPELRLDAGAAAQLQQEAFQVQRLAHDNIIRIFDFNRAGAIDFITMEWLEGETLATLLDRNGSHPLKMSEVKRILTGVTAGLAHAHARGIVHGDIKPANIFLCRDGAIKIMDFGLVRGPVNKPQSANAPAYAVTPGYASCELLEGREPCAQDDVYALALTIYRMVAGFRPRGRRTALQAESGGSKPSRPRHLTSEQWNVLRRGLALRRRGRLPDVDALLQPFSDDVSPAPRVSGARSLLMAVAVGLLGGAAVKFGLEANWPGLYKSTESEVASILSGVRLPVEAIEPDAAEDIPVIESASKGSDRRLSSDEPEKSDLVDSVDPTAAPSTAIVEPLPAKEIPVAGLAEPEIDGQPQAHSTAPADALPEPVSDAAPDIVTASLAAEDLSPAVPAPPVAWRTGFETDRIEVGEGDVFVRLVVRAPLNLTAEYLVLLIVESGTAPP